MKQPQLKIEKTGNITIFGRELIDENSVRQIKNCISSENDIAVLNADAHYGYGHPIGGAVAYRDKISLSGVGFDIACGNYAVRTDIPVKSVNIAGVMDEIVRRISFGIGRPNNEPVDHPVLEKINRAEFVPQRKLSRLAREQLGTVGSGNHFVDLFEDDDGFLWTGVHFGSRGFGHRTTMGFIAMSRGYSFDEKVREGSMDSPPILFGQDSEIARDYIGAMTLAGEYAYAGRELVVKKVLEILGNPDITFEVHNNHNFAWKEEHFGEQYWVVRKGCTPAFPGQRGFIGATMSDDSVIIEGIDGELSRQALYTTVHGAGRVMSRTKSAGKRKWVKDKEGTRRLSVISKGLVDFDEVKAKMKRRKIELRGADADEAPDCYKKLDEVLKSQGDTIKILFRLHPVGVAMAGPEIYDPYKD
ncbi:MAG TPA: RtcB family protein [Bacteroidales bacterium]|jgi:tRNA-splicing ligase RtcB|nr:RtcB family protein [Bacteroidales bacterium]HQH24228.1 RtcB family protein [Bacteroidales bacterium]HQJ83540.1 RtcB family protein [Bacteroidales bacterium]